MKDNNNSTDNNLFIIVECPLCGERMVLRGDKEIEDRRKFWFWCDSCLSSMFNQVNEDLSPSFKAIN